MPESFNLLNAWLSQKKAAGFQVPQNAQPELIKAYGPEDEPKTQFSPNALKALYVLEHAMLDKGFNPSAFTISKSIAHLGYRSTAVILCDYNISFKGHSYTVRRETDMDFVEYFSTLCLSDEHDEINESAPKPMHHHAFYQKMVAWLNAATF